MRRFRSGEEHRVGRLRRKPGGQWYFDYEEGERDDEIGFRFGEERFVTGEYVSVGACDTMPTYQVARSRKPEKPVSGRYPCSDEGKGYVAWRRVRLATDTSSRSRQRME